MQRSRLVKLCAAGAALTLLVAACGDDDDEGNTPAGGTEATDDTPVDTAADTTDAGDGGDATDDEGGDDAGGSAGDGSDLDATFGEGATAFRAAIEATDGAPLVAEGEPFVIAMPNLEGDAGGSFPDFREGAEAAVQLINERLGGIGADYESGTPGRPIELNACSHGLTPEAAQSCANDIAGQDPNLVTIGIDFFTPAMYPVFQQYPIIQMLPIFVADFTQPGSFSAIGGCPTAFFGAANYLALAGYDKVAVMHSDNAPGQQCWEDTTERPLQHFKDDGVIAEFQNYPNLPGDPSDDAAQYQAVASFLEGAENPVVYYSVQSSDCVEWTKGLRASGVGADIVMGSACVDETVLALPESVGAVFEFQSYNPDGELGEFETWELGVRADAIADYGPTAAVGTFMEDAFGSILWAWQIANYMTEQGADPWDRAALGETLSSLPPFHFVGRPSVDCSSNPEEYSAICYRKSTWLEWDGSAFGSGKALDGEYFDLTDLMAAVAASNPR